MNGEVIKEFLVGLGFKIDEAGLSKFSSGITNATIAVGAIGTAAVAAAGAITAFVSGVADKFDAVGDLADRVNTTVESVMRLGYVATLTGSSVEAANSSIENLSRIAGEAALGLGRGAKVFQDLGLSAKDSNGNLKDTSVLMAEIGDKIKDMGRGEQLAVLSKLGIDPTMINALTTDVSGLAAEFDQLYKNAGIDANKAAEQSGEFNDSMDRLKMTFDAIKSAVGLKFMGQVKNGIDTLRKFLVENMPKIINAVTPVINVVLRIAEAFIKIVGRVGSAIGAIIGFLVKVNDATDGWAGYILAAAAAWKFLNLSFLATPIGMILSLAAAIALLVDDFLTWKEGGDSLIDWSAWEPAITSAMAAIGALRDLLASAFTVMFAAVDALIKLLMGDFSGAWNAVGELVNGVIGIFTSAWDAIKKLGEGIGNFVGAVAGFFGGGSAPKPALTPSPQAAAAVTGGNQSISQQTQIVVQGSSNPDATARAVAGQQNRVNADMARNMKGAAR
jgi:phage-related protein